MTSHILRVRNVNGAFYEGWWWLRTAGVREDSRNGPVLVAQGPVLTEYRNPQERVLFNPDRDANPVFHLMECFWMLSGSNNVGWLKQFNARIAEYCEDDVMHGAYGHRWRMHFHFDQLERIIAILKKDPNSRQAVLQMWSPDADLYGDWKDRPCNTNIYFDCRNSALNMTVCCRSNDMLWGAYGANAVHFSFLQEVLAHEIGVRIGEYRQFSNNFHVYTENPQVKKFLATPPYDAHDHYASGRTYPVSILVGKESMQDLTFDCMTLMNGGREFRTYFMTYIGYPLMEAYITRKTRPVALGELDMVIECDWKLAFVEWMQRRENKDGSK